MSGHGLTMEGFLGGWSCGRHKAQAYKDLQRRKCFVVDKENLMEKFSSLSARSLVGRLEYFLMEKEG